MTASHPDCNLRDGHVCQRPSGKPCIEPGCSKPAGTLWGPHWCPEHDMERLDRITASLDRMAAEFRLRVALDAEDGDE